MRQRGYPGTGTFIMLDAVGPLEPDDVLTALRRTLETHPTTASTAAVSYWRAWPVWRIPDRPVTPYYVFDDLSREADWIAATEQRCQERFSIGWDPACPPQVRLEHYRGPGEQQRLVIRWPHALMDADGAQHFLAEMSRLADDTPAPLPNHLLPDGQTHNPCTQHGILRRLRLAVRAFRARAPRAPVQETSLCNSLPNRPADSRRLRYLVRPWSPEMVERMRENARQVAPSGPALYSRYIGGCVLRALHRVHVEHGRTLPYYGASFPLGVRGVARRPLTGNYLVSTALRVTPERIADPRAVAEDIDRQLREYAQRRLDLAGQAMLWLLAQLRFSQYRRLMGLQVRRQPFATGYSFYGEIDPPLRRFLGAEVTNLWGCGALSIPPGWNVTLSKFKDRINFAIAWPDEAFPENVVQRYADLIEEEACSPLGHQPPLHGP